MNSTTLSRMTTPTRASRVSSMLSRSRWAVFASLALCSGCQLLGDEQPSANKTSTDAVGEEGPNPAVVPAPLPDNALGNPATKTRNKNASAVVTATPLRMLTPEPFPPQPPVAARSCDKTLGELLLEMEAEFRWPGHAPSIKLPGLDKDERSRLQQRLGRNVHVELHSDGTMDMRLLGGAFPVAQGSHLQGRLDRFGQLLVWPDLTTYRVLPQGSLPALLREGRV